MKWFSLAVGGVLGTLARYAVSGLVLKLTGTRFPGGTMIVNLTGCLLIGIFAALGEEKIAMSYETKLFWITGFCGAYTTFSALILETAGLMKDGQSGMALGNIAAQLILGLLLLRGGLALGRIL
jgi:CrcB protein